MGPRLAGWLVLAVVAGCSPWTEEEINGFRHLISADASGRAGRLKLKVPVDEGETGMLFTANAETEHKAVFLQVQAPGGEQVFDIDDEWDSGRLKTGARYATDVVSFNWPIIQGDTPLAPGRWSVELGLVDNAFDYTRGVDVELDVVFKRDPDFAGGALNVRLVFAGATQQDGPTKAAVRDAVEAWESLYEQAGVTLGVTEGTWPDGSLTQPGYTSGDDYRAISGETPLGTVTVVIVEDLEGSPDAFGVSGGIPGPLVASERSVVVVSALTHSGADGEFNAEELRLLAETMAHEVGHYLGLFHPVEQTWDVWDAIDDTPECTGQAACSQALGSNLMFPYPICGSDSCNPTDELTALQGAAMNRYTGVR